MSQRREGLGSFADPSALPPPPAPVDVLDLPPPAPPLPEEEDPDAPVEVPESPSGWWSVFTPVSTFSGSRLGKTFDQGWAAVHRNEVRTSSVPGGKYRQFRLVDLFARDMGYRVEPVPVGVPPVHPNTLAAIGAVSAGVANS